MILNIHGSYEIALKGNIFLFRFRQQWNEECAKEFFQTYQQRVLEKKFKKFGALADFRELEGATPEVIAFSEKVSVWSHQQGQIARAQLINSELNAYIVNMPAKKLDLFPIQTFEDEDQAITWLESFGLAAE